MYHVFLHHLPSKLITPGNGGCCYIFRISIIFCCKSSGHRCHNPWAAGGNTCPLRRELTSSFFPSCSTRLSSIPSRHCWQLRVACGLPAMLFFRAMWRLCTLVILLKWKLGKGLQYTCTCVTSTYGFTVYLSACCVVGNYACRRVLDVTYSRCRLCHM